MIRMKKTANAVANSSYILFVLSMALIAYLFIHRVSTGSEITKMSDGQRLHVSKDYVAGKVLDCNGNLIVTGTEDGIAWYDNETREVFEDLLGVDIENYENPKEKLLGRAPWVLGTYDNRLTLDQLLHPNFSRVGGNVELTIDRDFQKELAKMVKDSGYENVYVIVSNYKTGEILGIYGNVFTKQLQPGSTMKPILAAVALTMDPSLSEYTYNCTGPNHNFKMKNGDCVHINCAGGELHGTLDMNQAIVHSCNGYFISLIQKLDTQKVVKLLNNWDFDTTKSYPQLFFWDGVFLNKSDEELDKLLGAIGQGNVNISPAGLNFCTNALANHGELMEPVIMKEKQITQNSEWTTFETKGAERICDASVADQVAQMMRGVVQSGTLKSVKLENFIGKTGTAEKNSGHNTVWTTGALIDEAHPYSITVCIDNETMRARSKDAGLFAAEILRQMMN